jgi:hypothetical protein
MPIVTNDDYRTYLGDKAKAELQAAYDKAIAPYNAQQQALADATAQRQAAATKAHGDLLDMFQTSVQKAQTQAAARPVPVPPPVAPVGIPQAADRGDRSSQSAPPTTAGLSGGTDTTGRTALTPGQIIAAADQASAWLGPQGQQALRAVLMTEGGLNGARGDSGKSAGPLQFYEGGQLASFAKAKGLTLDSAKTYVEAHPDEAIQWAIGSAAAPGYLGAAIQTGQKQGITGPDLATFAQRTGQVSVSPERAGRNWNAAPPADTSALPQATPPTDAIQAQPATQPSADTGAPTDPHQPDYGSILDDYIKAKSPRAAAQAAAAPLAAASTSPAATSGAAARDSQFGVGLSSADAYAACGPVAAVAFARSYGRNPTINEAMTLARSVGWSPGQGMAGIQSEKAMLEKIGVPTILENAVDWNHVGTDSNAGRPVIVSTPGHYFYVTGFNPSNGSYNVGTSGTDLKGGSDWMTPAQMASRMGAPQGALYVDPGTASQAPAASPPSAPAPVAAPLAPEPTAAQSPMDILNIASGTPPQGVA